MTEYDLKNFKLYIEREKYVISLEGFGLLPVLFQLESHFFNEKLPHHLLTK